MLSAVRGATTADDNDAAAIRQAVADLVATVLERNGIRVAAIVNVFFTVTPDLTALNPAKAVRQSRDDWAGVPMMCSQEPVVEKMLPRCVRIMIQFEASPESSPPQAVYLKGARELRPDLAT